MFLHVQPSFTESTSEAASAPSPSSSRSPALGHYATCGICSQPGASLCDVHHVIGITAQVPIKTAREKSFPFFFPFRRY